MSEEPSHPFLTTLRWLTTHTCFPASRLAPSAERLLLIVPASQIDEATTRAKQLPGLFHVKSRDDAKESALRAHALRRSLVHFKCDNSAKV